jgi:hypothetical protein
MLNGLLSSRHEKPLCGVGEKNRNYEQGLALLGDLKIVRPNPCPVLLIVEDKIKCLALFVCRN